MKKNKYLTILRSLSETELKDFSKFLSLRYHRSSVILDIHKYFKKNYLQHDPPDLEIVAKKILKKGTLTQSTQLANGLSDLFLILKDYLIHHKLNEKIFEKEFLWMEILDEKKLQPEMQLTEKNLTKRINQTESRSIWQNLWHFQINHFLYFRNNRQNDKKAAMSLQIAMHELDHFAGNMKLKMAIEAENFKSIHKTDFSKGIVQPYLSYFQQQKTTAPLNQYYLLLFALMERKRTIDFQDFRQFLFKNIDLLPFDENFMGMMTLNNFAAKKIREGDYFYQQMVFENYEIAIAKNLLIYRETIDKTTYENIVNVACSLERFDWALNFVHHYKNFLPIENQEDTYQLSLAMIAFGRQQFAQTILLLESLQFTEILQQLRAKAYIVRAHFELKNDDFSDKCDSFDRFIRRYRQRGKLSEDISRAALNFTKILREFDSESKTKREKLALIKQTKPLFSEKWLLTKV